MAKKTVASLMRSWPGIFPCDAVRVSGSWVEDSTTGEGLRLFASNALAKSYVTRSLVRVLREARSDGSPRP